MSKIRIALIGTAMAAGALLTTAVPAGAHVHGFTPLGCLTTDNPNSGAAVGFNQSADAASPHSGGPIIPLNASGKLPSGGQGAANACK
ncbi:MAG: hypothetical protein OEU32_09775 [Acidimicrobiia bacterium]|nr:hypothetical protein [Acidimicrobiia bacterium]